MSTKWPESGKNNTKQMFKKFQKQITKLAIMVKVQRETKSCKYTPEKQQKDRKMQWQQQHFYQDDGNQKQRENYYF